MGQSAIAIGYNAGYVGLGQNTVAIGPYAGYNSTVNNAIFLNGTGAILDGTRSGFYVNPIRADATTSATTFGVYYNPVTKEITTSTVSSGSGISSSYSGIFTITNATASASTITGALQVAGGVGIAGDLFVGGGIFGYAPLNSPIFEGTVQMESATFTGTVTMQQSVQKFVNPGIVAGAVALNFNEAAISVITPDNSNFTADIYNLPTTNNRTISISLILVQGATAYIPNAVLINGSGQTILWQGGVTPTGNANKRDIVSFTLLRKDSAWTVLGSLTSYG
jgi:hypothetical protein